MFYHVQYNQFGGVEEMIRKEGDESPWEKMDEDRFENENFLRPLAKESVKKSDGPCFEKAHLLRMSFDERKAWKAQVLKKTVYWVTATFGEQTV